MLGAAGLGWFLGIILNALADSMPIERRPRRPKCAWCTAPREWWAWSGLTDAALHQGRCPYCGRRRGRRAPIIEIVSLLGTMWLYGRDPRPSVFFPAVVVGFIFLLIAVIDLEHRLILHPVSVPSMLVLAAIGVLDPTRGAARTLLGGAAGAGSFFILFLLGGLFARVVSRRRGRPVDEVAFGFGDVMLAGLIGLTVGWPGVVLALFVGVLAAGLFSLAFLIAMVLRRRYTAFTPIPYGPFLILGAWLVYYGGRALFQSILLP